MARHHKATVTKTLLFELSGLMADEYIEQAWSRAVSAKRLMSRIGGDQ